MTLQGIGNSISMFDIKTEFGASPNNSLGAYRVSQNIGSLVNLPLDSGIPQGDEKIKFSDFYSKKLNVVIDFYSEDSYTRSNIKTQLGVGASVVGDFHDVPSVTTGKKFIANVNKTVGSVENSDQTDVALLTGQWDYDTELVINIGANGKIQGAGGRGGKGAQAGNNNGKVGKSGSSAIVINDSDLVVSIVNNGVISTGFGGGGGGSGKGERRQTGKKSSVFATSSGGGGGGGAGIPLGKGGLKGTGASYGTNGDDGDPAQSDIEGGDSGSGGSSAGAGGHGGDLSNIQNQGAVNEKSPKGVDTGGVGGGGGTNGYAIVTIQNSLPSKTGNQVVGREITNTTPTGSN